VEKMFGDPTEIGLLESAISYNYRKEDFEKEYPVYTEFPFDSERKRMSVVRKK